MKFQIVAIAALFAGAQAVSVGNAAVPVGEVVKTVENIAQYPGEITSEFVTERNILEGRQFINKCPCENDPAKCCCSIFTQAGQHSILHWLCVANNGDCTSACRG